MITENRTYLDPKTVLIPITDEVCKIASMQVEVDEQVLVGQIIANKYQGKTKIPVISTVSGTVKAVTQKIDRFGKVVDHVVIENDMKNTLVDFETFSGDIPPMVIRNQLLNLGIKSVTIDGLYTDLDFTNPVEHIIVNAVYINEPFISTDYEMIVENAEAIKDGILLIAKAAKTESITIIVDKFMNQEALDHLGKAISDTPIQIETVNSKKVKAWDYKIARKLVKEQLSTNLLDNGIIYTSVNACKMVHEGIRKGLPLTTREVAITGDAFDVNAIYNVRIGTKFTEIVEDLGGYNTTAPMNCHIGSFLTGNQAENDEFVIAEHMDSINVSSYREVEEDVCIKCGECNDVCPAGILPQNIMDAELRSVNERIVDLNTDECIECGLCTYVCPSKINVLEWVRRAKRRVG
jgi:electron transport complex protein RnfC